MRRILSNTIQYDQVGAIGCQGTTDRVQDKLQADIIFYLVVYTLTSMDQVEDQFLTSGLKYNAFGDDSKHSAKMFPRLVKDTLRRRNPFLDELSTWYGHAARLEGPSCLRININCTASTCFKDPTGHPGPESKRRLGPPRRRVSFEHYPI